MRLLISGEGPSDIGTCNNAQGVCTDAAFSPGPMAIWLKRLWEALLNYDLLAMPEAVWFISEKALAQAAKQSGGRMQPLRGKRRQVETALYYTNAKHLGLMARQLAADHADSVMAVLFRDADGTRSAPSQLWQAKWNSMVDGFADAAFDFGVPMLPKPKSEAWLLCAGQTARHSHAAFEAISGNDDSPNSAKKQWNALMGSAQTAAQEANWCAENPADWQNLLTMPSFKAFFDRFHEVAAAIEQVGHIH